MLRAEHDTEFHSHDKEEEERVTPSWCAEGLNLLSEAERKCMKLPMFGPLFSFFTKLMSSKTLHSGVRITEDLCAFHNLQTPAISCFITQQAFHSIM